MSDKQNAPFIGAACALVTPFSDGEIDYEALDKLIGRMIDGGIDALVMCGTTGEAPALTEEEYRHIVEFACRRTEGRIPVIAGAGGSSTKKAAKLAYAAGNAGASAVLAVTPYYNKASDKGLYLHYRELSMAGLPVILYNVPSRTGMAIPMDVYRRLADIDNIAAVKEASGDLRCGQALAYEFGDRYYLYSGCDELNLPLLSVGFDGFISVTANVVPADMAKLWRLWKEGDISGARELDRSLYPLTKRLFSEVNPIPVKAALSSMGLCRNELRLPLSPMEWR